VIEEISGAEGTFEIGLAGASSLIATSTAAFASLLFYTLF